MAEIEKVVVVGGSNGIGLAITKEFIKKGYYAVVFDIAKPDVSMVEYEDFYSYQPCNLLDFHEEQFSELVADESVRVLMITAGFGRGVDFENLHTVEIEKLFKVNTIAGLKLIHLFYKRLKSMDTFYCGMMGSIVGLISSPLFSVYAASKAAICRFIESVNVELEVFGSPNRILNVSPESIKGTKFNGASVNQVDKQLILLLKL